MKNPTDRSFIIWCFLLLFFGAVLLALDVMMTLSRFQDPSVSGFAAVICAAVLFGALICEIVAAIRGIIFVTNKSRSRRYRAFQSQKSSFLRLAAAAVILSLAEVVLSCVFGIEIWKLAVLVAAGILIPFICMISAGTLRS